MKREIKVWGERWLVRQDSTHAVSYLSIHSGYKCSWHSHKTKYNLFVVLTGQLILEVEELGEVRKVTLTPGETFTIKPGQKHLFAAKGHCTCIEEMYVEYEESDIDREEIGGKYEK